MVGVYAKSPGGRAATRRSKHFLVSFRSPLLSSGHTLSFKQFSEFYAPLKSRVRPSGVGV